MDLSDYIAPAGAEQEGKFWSGFLPALGGDVADMAKSLLEYIKTPGQVLQGEKGPEAGRDFAAQTAMLGYGVGPKVPGAAGMFGGELAKTANKAKLSEAKELAANGASRDEIWGKTGWFQGVDSKWRFEIPDAAAGVTDKIDRNQFDPEILAPPWPTSNQTPTRLQDIIHHPELFEAYPHLGNVEVKNVPLRNMMDFKGALTDDAKTMYLGSGRLQDFLSTTLHESQHAIQRHEDFARGGTVEPVYPPELEGKVKDIKTEFNNARDLVRDHVNPHTLQSAIETKHAGGELWSHEKAALAAAKEAGTLELFERAWKRYRPIADAESAAFERYHNLAGEVEARNVQERFKGGPIPIQTPSGPRLLQGDNPAPWYTKDEGGTMDVPAKDQIVVRQEDVSGRHNLVPVEHDPFVTLTPIENDPFSGAQP